MVVNYCIAWLAMWAVTAIFLCDMRDDGLLKMKFSNRVVWACCFAGWPILWLLMLAFILSRIIAHVEGRDQ